MATAAARHFAPLLLLLSLLLPLLLSAAPARGAPLPVVLMHGIDADASTMDDVVRWIGAALPGVYVKNVEVGDGRHDSVYMELNEQVDRFCAELAADEKLRGSKINLIGYSQGGLVARGFVERCNVPQVHNFITWSTPHAGEFGIPFVNSTILSDLLRIVAGGAYNDFVQHLVSFAGYWKDPFKLSEYLRHSIFLADINNERDVKNGTYRENMLSLNTFAMVYSTVDRIIIPEQSGWFYFFADGSDTSVVPLQKTEQYTGDWLGLQTLDSRGALKFYASACLHQDYPSDKCKQYFDEFTLPLLQG